MTFRIILAISALLLITYFGLVRRKHPLQVAGISLTFAVLFIFALAPDLSTELANLVGIGRGVDLALYIAIVFLLSFAFNLYIGQQEQNLRLTQLTRKLALAELQTQQQAGIDLGLDSNSTPDITQTTSGAYAVIPMFEEEAVITQVLQDLSHYGLNAIVIDDGSSDHSVHKVQELIKDGLSIILLQHPINLGQGAALMTGFDHAQSLGAKYIITFDSDGQHDPQDAIALLEYLIDRPHLDLVLGSRFLGSSLNMPYSRRLLLKFATLFTQFSGGPKLSDSHNGLRVIRKRALAALQLKQPRMAHASELLYLIKAHDLKFEEQPVTIRYTEHSLSKGQSAWAALTILRDLFLARFTRR